MDGRPSKPVAPRDLVALASSISTMYRPGGPDWRNTSQALYQRLRGSQSDFREFLQEVYPDSWSEIKVPRPGSYVDWIARQLATTYPNDPQIVYLDPATGKAHSQSVTDSIRRYRDAAGIRPAMQAAHEEMIVAGNGVVWLWPVIRRDAKGARVVEVVAKALPAHLQAVDVAEHPESGDERDVTTWWFRHPIPGGRVSETGLVRFGVVRVDRDNTVWETADGGLKDRPVWPNGPAHGLGQVPATVLRWFTPESGEFWAHARENVLATARAWDMAWTDGGDIAHMQTHGQWVGTNMTKVEAGKIFMSPRRVVHVGKDQTLEPKAPQPGLPGYVQFHESYMRVSIGSQDLNPATYLRSTAVTAEGKRLELYDRETLRRLHTEELARAEQRLYDLHRLWLKATNGAHVLPEAIVRPEYLPPEPPREPREELQAAVWRLAIGASNPATEFLRIAKLARVSVSEAEEMVKKNLETTKRLFGYIPQPAGVSAPTATPSAETAPAPDQGSDGSTEPAVASETESATPSDA